MRESGFNVDMVSSVDYSILPPVVYVPCIFDEVGGMRVAVRPLDDGRKGIIVYTALDRLMDMAGESTPWILMGWEELSTTTTNEKVEVIMKDVEIPAELR